MSGIITDTDIHFLDNIALSSDTTWTKNTKYKHHIYAQTMDDMMTQQNLPQVCFKTDGNIEITSEKSKMYGTGSGSVNYHDDFDTWDTWKNTEKSEIFLAYEVSAPSSYNIRFKPNTADKPYSWDLSPIDSFNITKYLPVVGITYIEMWDSVNDVYVQTTGTSKRCDLKTYIDSMLSSGLSEDDYYTRYPIIQLHIDGRYGVAGSRVKLSDKVSGASRSAGFVIQVANKNGKTITAHLNNVTSSYTALNNLTSEHILSVDIVTNRRDVASDTYKPFYSNHMLDYVTVLGDKTYVGVLWNNLQNCTLKSTDTLFDANDVSTPRRFKGDNIYKIAVNMYGYYDSTHDAVRIIPNFTIDQIMHYVALFGCYFTTDETLYNVDITDPYNIPQGVFLGHMDKNGWTDGTYAEGTAIRDFDSANKTINDISDTPYNPNSTPTNTDNLDNDKFGTNVQYASFSRKYLLTGTQLNSLYSVINNSADFKQKDGMQYFVSLQKIPQIFAENCICNTELVKFGDFPDPNIVADHVDGSRIDYAIGLITVGDIDVPQRYNNFLDYYPYTRHKMYLPYIGVVDLPPDMAGKHLNIKYSWDVENGNCTAYVTVATDTGLSVFASYSGNIYGDIVVTANNADIKQIKQALSLASGLNGIVSSGTSLNPFNIIGTTLNALQTAVDTEAKGYLHTKTSQGDFNNYHAPQYCKLITQYMYVDDFTPFEKSTGYNCNKWSKLSDVHGHTVIQNPNIGSSFMTIDEVEELNRLLESGVQLP